VRRISKNFFAIIMSDAVRRLLGFFTVTYLARTLTVADFGIMSIGFVVLSYATMASSGGLNSFGTRAVARGDDPLLIHKIVSLRVINAVIAIVIIGVAALFVIPNSTTAKFVALLSFSLVPNALLLDWYYQGKEKMNLIGAARVLSALVYLVLVLAFVHSTMDLLQIAVAAVVGDLLAALMLSFLYQKEHRQQRIQFTLKGGLAILKQAFPIGYGSILAHFSTNLPTLVIGILISTTEAGIYSAASKLVFVLLMLDRVFATLLLPASTRLYTESPERFAAILSTATRWIVIVALPLCIGGTLLAGKLLPFVFGVQYSTAGEVFGILVWFFLFTLLHTVYTTGLIAIGKEKEYGNVMVVSAFVYAIFIIVCTKLYGASGAAAAMVVAEALTLLLMRERFARFITIRLHPSLFRAILAALLMGVAVWFVPSLHVLAVVFVGGVAYTVLIFVLRAVTFQDVLYLLKRV
jgi:O-antigen/teichoic acid export membrane protein